MIRSAIGAELQSLIDYLNQYYPTEKDVVIVVLPGYDCVEGPDGERGWACYDPDECVIWVPGEPPEADELPPEDRLRFVLESIAHEFVHHLQNCKGQEFDDDEAERLAHEMIDSWIGMYH